MKKIIIYVIICVLLFLIPLTFRTKKPDTVSTEPPTQTASCPLLITANNETIPIEDYLIGVLAGEMPASFQLEALKAQAIAARTYVLKQTDYGAKPILTTTAHQVYNDQTLREQKWQTTFAEYEQKLTEAVRQTANQVLTYNDELITAMFHAASYQQTESAKNYSGNSIPYLKTTTSPEQIVPEEMHYTFEQINNKLQQKFKKVELQNVTIQHNDSNRIEQIKIGKKTWSGREFRTLLNLKSSNFTWSATATGITITTYGYGHGVGMSQYGANTMAHNGSGAEEILAHYYPNTTLETIKYCKK